MALRQWVSIDLKCAVPMASLLLSEAQRQTVVKLGWRRWFFDICCVDM